MSNPKTAGANDAAPRWATAALVLAPAAPGWAADDEDFASLRGDERFRRLLGAS